MNGWLFVALLWLTPLQTPQEVKTFTITARRFTYEVSPMPFQVQQGDQVTLNLVAADNGAGGGHGFRLRTYADSSHALVPNAPPVVVQFTAHTAGEFPFFCTRFCGNGHSSMDGVFTVIAPAPLSVADLSPASGPTNGGTTVTIHGAGFASGATVTFGGLSAASVEVVGEAELRAVTPAGPFDFASTKVVDVVVTNPSGATAQKSFTWTLPPPSIVSVSPSTGTRSGGTLVTIQGVGFSTAVPLDVMFGGVAGTSVAVVDAVTLTVRTPVHGVGAADVAITTSKGSVTSTGAFRFLASKRRALRR
jgi:IPT/TIG domain